MNKSKFFRINFNHDSLTKEKLDFDDEKKSSANNLNNFHDLERASGVIYFSFPNTYADSSFHNKCSIRLNNKS